MKNEAVAIIQVDGLAIGRGQVLKQETIYLLIVVLCQEKNLTFFCHMKDDTHEAYDKKNRSMFQNPKFQDKEKTQSE
jgi:hypothetical protein